MKQFKEKHPYLNSDLNSISLLEEEKMKSRRVKPKKGPAVDWMDCRVCRRNCCKDNKDNKQNKVEVVEENKENKVEEGKGSESQDYNASGDQEIKKVDERAWWHRLLRILILGEDFDPGF